MLGLGWDDVRQALDISAIWNQQQIAKGLARTQQQQAEWNQQAQLLTLQAQAQAQALQHQSTNSSNRLVWVALMAGIGIVGFMALRGK